LFDAINESHVMMDRFVKEYMRTLEGVVTSALVTDMQGNGLGLEASVRQAGQQMRNAHETGKRLFFIGNGGSAGISSHMATDYSKNGGMRASSLTDGSTITCLANDYGYEHIFEKQLEWHGCAGDIVVAISSSGRSKNILNGVRAARERGCIVYTLSGFTPDNPLRQMGDLNFYLDNKEYGFVEIGHLALLHTVLDIQMGWQPAAVSSAA
jgi:D-sedoheptulose 7-phosphate isomerase